LRLASVKVTQPPGGEESNDSEALRGGGRKGLKMGYGSRKEGGGVKEALVWEEWEQPKEEKNENCNPSPQPQPQNQQSDPPKPTPTMDLYTIPPSSLFSPSFQPSRTPLISPSLNYREYASMLHSVMTFLRRQSAKVEFVDLWFQQNLPETVEKIYGYYIENDPSSEDGAVNDEKQTPEIPGFMEQFKEQLCEIRLVMKEIKVRLGEGGGARAKRQQHTITSITNNPLHTRRKPP